MINTTHDLFDIVARYAIDFSYRYSINVCDMTISFDTRHTQGLKTVIVHHNPAMYHPWEVDLIFSDAKKWAYATDTLPSFHPLFAKGEDEVGRLYGVFKTIPAEIEVYLLKITRDMQPLDISTYQSMSYC
ncbi:hypothetical protein JCM19237_4330 [Photobacterium aphoticum]|uniref:Uncharacterized protein n=1 Tax=Photobacterium aphoticum TaxID=754436 RepID=A0A090QT21_9GAMM|nr:hypothetical protein JCM19237_4330 [Photobacterium aphoticum]